MKKRRDSEPYIVASYKTIFIEKIVPLNCTLKIKIDNLKLQFVLGWKS